NWGSLQEAANDYASFNLMLSTELVHKILSELTKGGDSAVAYATAKLLSWLTEIVAVQRGVMVKSDNTYYSQVRQATGDESEWSRLHRLVSGIEPVPTDRPPARTRGMGALRLYRETLKLME